MGEAEKILIPTMKLSVVIVNYRTPQLVIDAIQSLLPELNNMDARVIIVDNNSCDASLELIGQWIKENSILDKVRLVEAPGNIGFSGGNNFGINSVDSEFYILLNSDTIIRPGAISTMLETARQNLHTGIVSPRLEWMNGQSQESCFSFFRPVSELVRVARTGPVTRLLKKFDVPHAVLDQPSQPEWTSFACVLVRREVFDQIGLLDDSYFMYFEDVEFCFRMYKAGWHIVNNPAARVVHLRGGSSEVKKNSSMRKRLPKYYYESRTKYYYQCFGWSGLFLANTCWILGRVVSLLREITGTKQPHLCEKEWLDIWINFLSPNAKSTMLRNIK